MGHNSCPIWTILWRGTFCSPSGAKSNLASIEFKRSGFEYRDIGIGNATDNLAGARVIRLSGVETQPSHQYYHNGEFLFLFVLQGEMTLSTEAHGGQQMLAGDCCVTQTQFRASVIDTSTDVEFLEVFFACISVTKPAVRITATCKHEF